jgi:hypothetical protein
MKLFADLFADLYLDEDVSVLVATLLRGRGLDAVTAVGEHMLGLDDSAQLAHAAAMGRCVVTHNRVHFELLHRQYVASGRDHAGIIVATTRRNDSCPARSREPDRDAAKHADRRRDPQPTPLYLSPWLLPVFASF